MWQKWAGRIVPWLAAVGAATFTLLDVGEPGWWATGMIVVGTLIQLALGIFPAKT